MTVTTQPRPAPDEIGHPDVVEALRAEIAREGAITFARFMEQALYHPDGGYYRTPARRPGRGGDFLTAPEVHPFFGITIANQVAELWERLDRPDPFVVREYGPGVGGLAYDIIAGLHAHHPEVIPALRYRLRDVNRHRMAEAMSAMMEVGLDDIVSVENPEHEETIEPVTGVVLANEVADALPAHELVWTGDALREHWVVWDPATDWFAWEVRDLSPEVAATDPLDWLRGRDIDPTRWPAGSRIAWSPALTDWIGEIGRGLDRGYALIIDYGYPALELYRDHLLEGTIRAYREHTVSDDPFQHVGEQDLTVHVDFTRITDAAEAMEIAATPVVSQGDFLSRLEMGQLLVGLQGDPEIDMLGYHRAQAAVFRLIDPGGLGRFRVVGLAKNAPLDPLPTGFTPDKLPESLRI
ncbi:MAG TPA: SAM-dependent methyltransferase [Thermomicrobiales bacterium]|nr:SAM-dependent methyltransferase [Thermomicrobiales bacterium]